MDHLMGLEYVKDVALSESLKFKFLAMKHT